MTEKTFALIKPDAVLAGHTDAILEAIRERGFRILAQQRRSMDRDFAIRFYQEHAQEPWFDEIIDFMTSGPVVALVLEKDNAIRAWRKAIGHRWPPRARELDPTCLRARFGSLETGANALHGSDAPESAQREMALFGFTETE